MRIKNNNLPSGILAGVKPISFARGGVVYRQAGTREADLYDPSNILGWIPDRFVEVKNKKFSFINIDVDIYEPTKKSLEFFFPRLILEIPRFSLFDHWQS